MITERVRARAVTGRAAVPAARIDGLVTTETADEVLVYDKERHHIHHLNRTSAVVWRLCDGSRSVEEIGRLASAQLGEPVDADIVRLALNKLADANLMASPMPQELRPATQSRRTFMRRAAVAGAVAVPAIVSMTAPANAAGSQSACGIPCSNSGFCSGNPFNNICNNCGWTDCQGVVHKVESDPPPAGATTQCTCPPGQQGGCPNKPPITIVCPAASTDSTTANSDTQNAPLNQPQTNSLIEQPTDTATGTDGAAPTDPAAGAGGDASGAGGAGGDPTGGSGGDASGAGGAGGTGTGSTTGTGGAGGAGGDASGSNDPNTMNAVNVPNTDGANATVVTPPAGNGDSNGNGG